GPSSKSILAEAKKRRIPFYRIDENSSLVMLGQGVHQKKIRATMTSATSSMGVEFACDKEATKNILRRAFIPVPQGELVKQRDVFEQKVKELGFPLVVKPLDGNHGRGITTNIKSMSVALEAF